MRPRWWANGTLTSADRDGATCQESRPREPTTNVRTPVGLMALGEIGWPGLWARPRVRTTRLVAPTPHRNDCALATVRACPKAPSEQGSISCSHRVWFSPLPLMTQFSLSLLRMGLTYLPIIRVFLAGERLAKPDGRMGRRLLVSTRTLIEPLIISSRPLLTPQTKNPTLP